MFKKNQIKTLLKKFNSKELSFSELVDTLNKKSDQNSIPSIKEKINFCLNNYKEDYTFLIFLRELSLYLDIFDLKLKIQELEKNKFKIDRK